MKPFVISVAMFVIACNLILYAVTSHAEESDEQFIEQQQFELDVSEAKAQIEREVKHDKDSKRKFYDEHPFLRAFIMTTEGQRIE